MMIRQVQGNVDFLCDNMGEDEKLLKEFRAFAHHFAEELMTLALCQPNSSYLESEVDRIFKFLKENTASTFQNFPGFLTMLTFKSIVKKPSVEELRMAMILGWCNELSIYQMTNSVNDTNPLTLHQRVLEHFFGRQKFYPDLIELSIKLKNRNEEKQDQMSQIEAAESMKGIRLNMNVYKEMASHKQSYYQIAFPITTALAMTQSLKNENMKKDLAEILLEIGVYLQVHNDFHSVFYRKTENEEEEDFLTYLINFESYSPNINGCSWLLVKAAQSPNLDSIMFQFLVDNTSNPNADKNTTEKVKRVLTQCKVAEDFKFFKETVFNEVVDKIQATLTNDLEELGEMLCEIMTQIKNRN